MTQQATVPRGAARGRSSGEAAPGAVLALDIGGTQVRAAAVAADGAVLARRRTETPRGRGRDALVAASVELLAAVRDALAPDAAASLRAIGVSAVGPLDPARGILIEPPNVDPAFHDLPVTEPLQEALQLPAVMERDTHVAALAERAYGAAQGVDDFLYLTVSTGLGGAIVTRGRLLGGPDGVAGELGHLVVDVDGPPCGCGHRGHLEGICSGSGIARQARTLIEDGRAPGLRALADRIAPAPLEAKHVAEAEEAGDPDAAALMERVRRTFAAAMVGLVDVFDPDLIVIGGSLARHQGERWLDPARREVERYAFTLPRRRVRIVPAALGDDVGLVGAVPLVESRLARPAELPDAADEEQASRTGIDPRATQRPAIAHSHPPVLAAASAPR